MLNSLLIEIKKEELVITDQDWKNIEDMKTFLSTFKTCLEFLCSEKDSNINLVLLTFCEMKAKLEPDELDSSLIKSLKKNMMRSFKDR